MRHPALWLMILVLAAAPAAAQISAGGSVRGTVRDQQGGVLPGVTVTATSPSASRPAMAVTDAQGYYRLTDLQPGSYVLTAELSGFTKYERRGVDIRAALNIDVDIPMQVGAISETVQVTAETPMLEVQKPVQAVNISGDLQRQLPLLPKRDWSSYLELTPSVTSMDNGLGYSQVYLVRGGEMYGHVFQLDGTDIGGFRQARADAIQLSGEAIQDVQVKTGALDASAPIGTGVVVNMVTKSGTNAFHGSASMLYQNKAWNGNNAAPGGTPGNIALTQPDVSAGGPIVKNKAFFFGVYQYSKQITGLYRTADNIKTLTGLKPDFKPFDNENRFNFYFAKGTVQFSPNHEFMGYVENDIAPKDVNTAIDSARFERDSYGGKAFGARFSSVWGSKVTTKFAWAWNDKSYSRDPDIFIKNPGPSIAVCNATGLSGGNRTCQAQVAQLDNMQTWTTSPTWKTTISGDLTFYQSGWAGKHEFQTGFFLQPGSHNENHTIYPNGGQNLLFGVLNDVNNPAAGYKIFQKRQWASEEIMTKSIKAQDYGFYVQDLWKPMTRLSLSLGLRADKIIIDDLIFDKNLMNAWHFGPRVGATYMVTDNGRNVLRASWTKVHDMPQGAQIAVIGSTRETQTDYYDNNLDGVFENSVTIPASTVLNQNRVVDPKNHMGYFTEQTVGFAKQFKGQVSVDATFIRRNWMDRPALVDINGIYDGVVFKGYKDPTLNDIYQITNNTWNWFVYTALELTVSKRGKNFQVIGGYTRAWQHLEGTWQPNDPAFFIQPGAFPNDKGIGSFVGNNTSSIATGAETRSYGWRPHVARIGGSYRFPYQLTLSSSFSMMSGAYSGPIYKTLSAADPQFGPATLSLLQPNGTYRSVPNPLSTTSRFAYSTRSEGQLQSPTQLTWNIKLDRTFTFASRKLVLGVDMYNLTNNGADQRFAGGATIVGNANYGIGQMRQLPRGYQVSARFEF